MKRVSSVAVTAMPKLPPSWRDRLKSPVPWAIWSGRRSATVAAVSGTKMSPSADAAQDHRAEAIVHARCRA